MKCCICFVLMLTMISQVVAGDKSEAVGDPAVEAPTLRCLGAYWIIRGDDNKNARIDLNYRKAGTQDWKPGPPLFRVAKDANKDPNINVPDDGWLFAGSVIDVPEATEYELQLKLSDPDGGNAEKTLKTR